MRIGIVCYPTVGGSGVVATEVAYALANRGHEVHLLSYDRPSRLRRGVPGLQFHPVTVTAYPLFRYPPYDLALATRMLEVREEAGQGIERTVRGLGVRIGSAAFTQGQRAELEPGEAQVHVAIGGVHRGFYAVRKRARSGMVAAVQGMAEMVGREIMVRPLQAYHA